MGSRMRSLGAKLQVYLGRQPAASNADHLVADGTVAHLIAAPVQLNNDRTEFWNCR